MQSTLPHARASDKMDSVRLDQGGETLPNTYNPVEKTIIVSSPSWLGGVTSIGHGGDIRMRS